MIIALSRPHRPSRSENMMLPQAFHPSKLHGMEQLAGHHDDSKTMRGPPTFVQIREGIFY
jgi:hypothetical protein